MLGCNLYGSFLELEEIFLEHRRQSVFCHTCTSVLRKHVGSLQVNVVWRNLLDGCPTVVDDINKLFGNVDGKLIVPTVVEPLGKVGIVGCIVHLYVQLTVTCKSAICKVTATHEGEDLLEVAVGVVC